MKKRNDRGVSVIASQRWPRSFSCPPAAAGGGDRPRREQHIGYLDGTMTTAV